MITGQIKNQIGRIWDTFLTEGVTTPVTILGQKTHLFFMKMIDDAQISRENS